MTDQPLRVVILGGGGHASLVLAALRMQAMLDVVGFTSPGPPDAALLDCPFLGTDDVLPELARHAADGFIVGVGSIDATSLRQRLFDLGLAAGLAPVTVTHGAAIVAPTAVLGRGTVVMAGAVVSVRARIGDNCIVNTGAIVGHDSVIADHVHIAVGACLSGGVRVGEGALVGAGATIKQGIQIGAAAVVGLGAAVIRDVPPGSVVAGVPAKLIRGSGNRAAGGVREPR